MAERAAQPPGDQDHVIAATSDDKVLSIQLNKLASGIAVQRTEIGPAGRRVEQSLHFANESEFIRWCEADDLRFAYPLLFSNVARSGRELFRTYP